MSSVEISVFLFLNEIKINKFEDEIAKIKTVINDLLDIKNLEEEIEHLNTHSRTLIFA